jgi:hypothetical protein
VNVKDLSFDDLPGGEQKKGISALSFDDLPSRPSEAAAVPEVATPFGTIKGESSGGFNPAAAIISAGGAMDRINRGIMQAKVGPADWLKQKLGMQPSDVGQMLAGAQEAGKKPMAELREVHPGSALIGEVAPAAAMPWRALPAVAAAEYGSPGERATRGGLALAGNALAGAGANIAGRAFEASKTKAAEAAAMNASTAKFREAGLRMPASITNPTVTNRALEGVAGGVKTEQALSRSNQPAIDKLIKQDLGIAPSVTVTPKVLDEIRATEGKAYKAIKEVPKYVADDVFAQEIQSVRPAISTEVPEMANPAIDKMIAGLSKEEFSGTTAIELVKRLRYQSNANFKNRMDPEKLELAQAQRSAAEAMESLIDRNLAAMGDTGKLSAYRAARERIAKTYDAEAALMESGSFAAKDIPLKKSTTGGMRLVAEFYDRFPKSAQKIDSATKANPFSVVDALFSGGAAAASGNPLMLAGVAARPALRGAITSRPYQNLMGTASEKPRGLMGSRALDNEMAPFIAGLLGYQAGR